MFMPELAWDPVDFLDVLEVVPLEEEFGTSYLYKLKRNAMTIELHVYPLAGDVLLRIPHDLQAEPLINLRLLGCPAARVVQDKRGEFIEFAAANAFMGRFDERASVAYGFRLRVKPFIQAEPFSYPG
jgi:hypothetical protein